MKNKYIDLIEQTFDFPQDEFKVVDNELVFHDIPLMDIIKQYGTPLRISYLPKISSQIQLAKRMFNVAMAKVDYKGSYNYCYCTKSSHFSFILEEALKNDIGLETSSSYDIYLIQALYGKRLIDKNTHIICNGFKREQYIKNIADLINDGFKNTILVLDNKEELSILEKYLNDDVTANIGIRIASEEEPKFDFYTSRLGINYKDIIDYYHEKIKGNKKFNLKMLHFFINTGIKDTSYYWSELNKCINLFCNLKKESPELDSLNIGGGFPIKNSLSFEYDYEYMAEEVISQIKNICTQYEVDEPNIFTEFGSYTVGESGAILYSILNKKKQNDRELWYMIDSSFMTTLPDTWGIKQRYILLAVNNWNKEYNRVFIGGLTCDSEDYYNAEAHANAIYLPEINYTQEEEDEIQYIGFFHTGAYQESIAGYGGIQHCLTPAPKHIILDVDPETGEYTTRLFAKEQSYQSMLKTLGY
ncbi:MAG: arginine decarboxylase [Bacteroidetes bacterium]|nr:arginine decarboxylase [Bacteroidota bacterium]